MSKIAKFQIATQFYDTGNDLFQKGCFYDAVEKLKRAEDVFRKLDARGDPFGHFLPNGVSGLANACYVQGLCYERIGDQAMAITCYETSLINEKFERKGSFKPFLKSIQERLIMCYEKEREKTSHRADEGVLHDDPELDLSFRYPFSLTPELIPAARLYELAPERYRPFKDFYVRGRHTDAKLRHINKKSDETVMKKMSVYVWSVMTILWVVYGIVVVKVLLIKRP